MFRTRTHVLLASVFVLVLFGAGSASAQSAFAKVRADCTVATFGGSDTSNASAVHSSVGQYTVTFTGAYLATITPDDVVINTTAESLNYGVTNTFVVSASPNQIVIYVYVWTSSTLTYLDNNIFISVNVGTSPIIGSPASSSNHPKDTSGASPSQGS